MRPARWAVALEHAAARYIGTTIDIDVHVRLLFGRPYELRDRKRSHQRLPVTYAKGCRTAVTTIRETRRTRPLLLMSLSSNVVSSILARMEQRRSPPHGVRLTTLLCLGKTQKKPNCDVPKISFGSLILPNIQLVFSNFHLKIGRGIQDHAPKYTVKNTRVWPAIRRRYQRTSNGRALDSLHL
ncbi:hypothetical protein BDV95DRAFT_310315 [Massariosphaeria phaeospora]|uniref:Uncharacterized protein n=1 Tax=Massariosphaeria phaeospora TaxID=100035 RepID=A0A7C8MDS8_9PLEO|nr:hypothetical protein BDV95DRAFT_310315 [Massariosphaeria phaeospora]